MKATEITDATICKVHCDVIKQSANDIKSLFCSDFWESKVRLYRNIAFADIERIEASLCELKLSLENLDNA